MRNFFYLIITLFTIGFLTSCTKVDNVFGSEYLESAGVTNIIRVDTFTADLQTIYTDSFPTQAKGTTMVGGYTDPYFGKVKAQSFMEMAIPEYADIYANTVYDSVALIMKVKQSDYYGDSTKPLHIDVNRLTENITTPVDQGINIYNIDTFAYNSTPLGSKDVVVRPYSTDTISVKLSDALGKQLFSMLQRGSDTIKTQSIFSDFFKGLRIGTNAANSLVLNCKDTVKIRISYRKFDVYTYNKTVELSIYNNYHHFVNITADRTGTPLSGLGTSFKSIHSSKTNNAAYTQTATGVSAKITFPTLKQILQAPNYVKLLRAVLVIKPVKTTYETKYLLPTQLRLSTTGILNTLGTDLYILSSTGTAITQYGNLQIDYINGENTNYSYDISIYAKQFLSDNTVNQYTGLLVIPPTPQYETALDRLVMGNRYNTNGSISLQLYYATVQP